MKATELRIGNWVYKRIGSKCGLELMLHQVTAGNIGSAASDDNGIDFLQPIPLTPEILEKCGFRHAESLGLEYVTMPNIVIRLSDMMYGCIDYEGRFDETIKINSVHQLQNLYFSLTGEELNYKP